MASEEPAPRDTQQTAESRRQSAPPVVSVAPFASTATVKTASANDNTSVPDGFAVTATPASNDVDGNSHEQTTCETANQASELAEKASERTAEGTRVNAAQASTPTMIKVEQQPGEPSIARNIPPVATDTSKECAANPIKMEKSESGLPSAFHPPQEPKTITLDNLRKVADSTDLSVLEASVEVAQPILNSIRVPMADSKQPQQLEFLKPIDDLKTKSKRTRTVVAIAGATGAGKSSCYNALLDEEKLLTTSSFRACTSVITEISYNDVDDPQQAYRAEVEFISLEEWTTELMLLIEDFSEGDQQLSSSAYRDEAEIASAKIRAVYPDLTEEMIAKSKPEQLAKRDSVSRVLGTTRKIAHSNARDLHSEIQVYLDSKDKDTKGAPRKPQDMAFWPLIKVVRVYCKADALSTGVVLVDLPGTMDSNAARSAVSKKYMAECSAVWVAAPIKRAVDDKTAKDLLGKGSRLQLKLDGIYSNVTFICTMTDAVQLDESLDLDDGRIQAILSKSDDRDKAIWKKETTINKLEQQLEVSTSAFKSTEKELKLWLGLEKKKKKGKQVYAPRIPAKRKRPATASRRTSRRQMVVEVSSDDDDDAEQIPLTLGEIKSKLDEIGAKLQSQDDECTEMENKLKDLNDGLVKLQADQANVSGETTRACIQLRNERVREISRVDFAAGIMEIDEEDAQDDEETYDPSIRKRDYDEVARSLPVFCISSRAYQQLRGRAKRDAKIVGFQNLLDTEIPLLQEHAKKLPEKNRILAHKAFLNDFFRLLNSLTIWVADSALELNASVLSEQDQGYEMKYLHATTENLKKDISLLIMILMKELEGIKRDQLDSRFTHAISQASKAIEVVVSKWSTKTEDGGDGIKFATYRAICRRDGSKTKSVKSRDFNEDIQQPLLSKLATNWEEAFCRLIPASLDKFVAKVMQVLHGFYDTMASRPELSKCKKASLNIIRQQIESHEASIVDMINNIKATIQAEQREANRAFLPEIKKLLVKVYARCAAEKGAGCFMRMKDHMFDHIHRNKSSIYRKATQRVSKDLDKLFESNRKELEKAVHGLVDGLERDFRTVISSSKMLEMSEVARDHIRDVLYTVDAQFEKVLCAEKMDIDPPRSPRPAPQVVSADPVASGAPETDVAQDSPMADVVPGVPQTGTAEDMVIDS